MWSSPAMQCWSRPAGRSVSRTPWRRSPREAGVARGRDRDAALDRGGPRVHRLRAPARARPADPRGGPRRPHVQAGHTHDGRSDPAGLRAADVCRTDKAHDAGADGAGVTIACAAIGFVDDWFKLVNRRSLGLSGRWKMLALL